MSYDEFLAAFDETVQAEWVDGEAIIFMPPTTLHQRVVGFLFNLLSFYAECSNWAKYSHRHSKCVAGPIATPANPILLTSPTSTVTGSRGST